MKAVFRDKIGSFVLENVENIQYSTTYDVWSVMFSDYETQEVKGQLIEVSTDEY